MKTFFKAFGLSIAVLLGVIILTLGSYVLYVSFQYYRIEDNKNLDIDSNQTKTVKTNENLTFTSYNIGFGAYSHDYSFFLDKGYDKFGNLITGKYGRAYNKESVIYNTKGAISIMENLNSDFYAIQEVDYDSTRSHKVNQIEMIKEAFLNYANTFALNFHSAYLCYPFFDMHGKNNSGLLTLSKYKMLNSTRKSYEVSTAFFDKFFDLDRCFSVNEIEVENGKKLILVNSHMSAYDEGGKIRNRQIEQLNQFMLEEYNKGNYVVVGGDFNHDLLTYNPDYSYTKENIPFDDIVEQKSPDWVSYIFNEDGTSIIDSHFKIKAASDNPTVRGCEAGYVDGFTYVNSVDGFIVSDNVECISVSTLNSADLYTKRFAYSDHQATTLKFKLK